MTGPWSAIQWLAKVHLSVWRQQQNLRISEVAIVEEDGDHGAAAPASQGPVPQGGAPVAQGTGTGTGSLVLWVPFGRNGTLELVVGSWLDCSMNRKEVK